MAPMMVVVGGTVTTSGDAAPITSLMCLACLESNCRGPLSPEPGALGIRSFFCGIRVMSFPVVGPLLILLTKVTFHQIVSIRYSHELSVIYNRYSSNVMLEHQLDNCMQAIFRLCTI